PRSVRRRVRRRERGAVHGRGRTDLVSLLRADGAGRCGAGPRRLLHDQRRQCPLLAAGPQGPLLEDVAAVLLRARRSDLDGGGRLLSAALEHLRLWLLRRRAAAGRRTAGELAVL